MTKLVSFIMSIIMALFSVLPGIITNDPEKTMPTGAWLTLINNEFGMTSYENTEPYFESVTNESEYFDAVQIAYEWGIITDEDEEGFDVTAPVTAEFVAVTLKRVARLELKNDVTITNAAKLDYPDEVAVAVSNGLFKLSVSGRFNNRVMSYDDCLAALTAAKDIWANKTFNETKYDYTLQDDVDYGTQGLIVDENGEIVTDNGEVVLEDVFEEISFEGNFVPNFEASKISDSQGNVLNDAEQGDPDAEVVYAPEGFSLSDLKNFDIHNIDYIALLKKVKLSFSVGGFKVKAKVNDNGFNVSVSGTVCDGVNITKAYDLSNFNVNAKLDCNVLRNNIKDSYVRVDYDLVETTLINGSYAASLAETPLAEGEDPVDFLTRVKEGLFELTRGANNKIKIFKIDVPIPNVPGVSIGLELSLVIDCYGRIEITVTSSEVKGYEIVNNKARFINNSEVYDKDYIIAANAEVKATLDFQLNVLGVCIVDVAFTGGIGIGIRTTVFVMNDDGSVLDKQTLDLPFDLAVETTVGANRDNLKLCANANLYGILKISVGTNSKILSKLGLTKTWTIFDESNGTFATFHIEESGIVDHCTRAA